VCTGLLARGSFPTRRSSELVECASGANSNWLSKEELEQAWKASATRKAFYGDARFSANPAYRKAVGKFEELVLKIAAKNAAYQPDRKSTRLNSSHVKISYAV